MRVFIEKDDPYWQGWIYRGEGAQGCAHLLALVNKGARGVQKIQFRNKAQFPRFFLF
jgi:hypothetical protein